MANTHYALITGPTPDDVQMIAAGDEDFCIGALTKWVADHPLFEFTEAEIVKRVGVVVGLSNNPAAPNNIDESTGRLERLPVEGEFYTRSRDGVKVQVTRTKTVNPYHPDRGADVEYVKNGETHKQWVFFSNFSRTYQWSEHQGWE